MPHPSCATLRPQLERKQNKNRMITFQNQLRLFSGLGTARSAHAGSRHDFTALQENNTHTHTVLQHIMYPHFVATLEQ